MDTRKFSQNMVGALNERKPFAFKRLYDSYHAPLKHLARQLLENRFGAEEIVNDAFLELHKKDLQFETVRNIERYLGRAVRTKSRDFLEKEEREVIKMNGVRAYVQKIEDTAVKKADDKSIMRTLEAMATQMLPGKCREIFILSQVRGLRNKEIAELLNISEKTVENQINIARNKLREQCKKDGIDMYYINLLLPILCSQIGSN